MSAMTLKEYKETHKDTDPRVLILDGDWLVYQAMAASEVETNWGDDCWTLECDHGKAWNILTDAVNSFSTRKKEWRKVPIVMAFTDAVNWRKELVDPTYKENRKAVRKPVGYREFVKRVQECTEWSSVMEPNLEGDDVMGIIGSGHENFGFDSAVMVSCDKDFKTIPDVDFLWCTTGNILHQTKESADYWHLFQTIKGDITDGYQGIPGWGDKALDWLEDPYAFECFEKTFKSGARKGQTVKEWRKVSMGERSLWEAIVSLGAKAGITEQDVISQARMARILRYNEYNIETGEITLWSPQLLD